MKQFLINRLKILGKKQADYFFKEGLNIIEGRHNSGKSNLLEILKMALGGNGDKIDDMIFDSIDYTLVEILLESRILTLKRFPSKTGKVFSYFNGKISEISKSTNWIRIKKKEWSNLILNEFGITGEVFQGRGRNNVEISFYMLYHLIYIDQDHWKGIESKLQSENLYQRIATFLYALNLIETDQEKLKRELDQLSLEEQKTRDYRNFIWTKIESFIPQKINELEQNLISTKKKKDDLDLAIKELKNNYQKKYNEIESKVISDLNNINSKILKNKKEYKELDNEVNNLENYRNYLEASISFNSFENESNRVLNSIIIEYCPNCGNIIQEIKDKNHCYICKQEMDLELQNKNKKNEQELNYLKNTLIEINEQILKLNDEMGNLELIIEKNSKMKMELEEKQNIILNANEDPIIKNIEILYKEKSVLESELDKIKMYQNLVNYYDETTKKIEDLSYSQDILKKKLKLQKEKLSTSDKIKKFSDLYMKLLNEFKEIRIINKVELSPNSKMEFLPIINDVFYLESSGAVETILRIIVYHLTLLILYQEDISKFPPLLIFDTPRQQEMNNEIYRKLIHLLSENSKQNQIILTVATPIPLEESLYYKIKIPDNEFTIN